MDLLNISSDKSFSKFVLFSFLSFIFFFFKFIYLFILFYFLRGRGGIFTFISYLHCNEKEIFCEYFQPGEQILCFHDSITDQSSSQKCPRERGNVALAQSCTT